MTVIVGSGERDIARAASLIRAGEPVAIPTETVYGLAADATSGVAVARIYAAKGRPSFNPLIVHALSAWDAGRLARLDNVAITLADAFWPGPLTMVLPLAERSAIAGLATAGLPTIAVRVPAHPTMRALLTASGCPLAAPSANASGGISPTTAEHVASSLGGRIPMIVDGGPTGHGIESTIIQVSDDGITLLRPGPITSEAITQATGWPVRAAAHDGIVAPGQLASHYAPSQPVRLDASVAGDDEWLLGFGSVSGDDSLSDTGDMIEAASRLFACLHRAEASGRPRIAVAPVPDSGLGAAINDRLRRAAAPRPR